jgi:hypothetical protein
MTYDIPQHISGDTWQGINDITITRNNSALNLTNAYAELIVKFQIDAPTILNLNTDEGTLVFLHPLSSGQIQAPPQIIDIPPANYKWALKVRLANGEVDTFVNGNWPIVKLV